MNRFDKTVTIGLAAALGAIGLAALAGALFFEAAHQLVIVSICTLSVALLIVDVRREERESKQPNKS